MRLEERRGSPLLKPKGQIDDPGLFGPIVCLLPNGFHKQSHAFFSFFRKKIALIALEFVKTNVILPHKSIALPIRKDAMGKPRPNSASNESLLSFEERIKAYEKDGRWGPAKAREFLFKTNQELFKSWDSALLGDKNALLNGTKVYREEFRIEPKNPCKTSFSCVNADCVDVARKLVEESYNPAILNLASNVSPGGGYHKGTNAQEESLCQRSTLSCSLYQFGDCSKKWIRDSGFFKEKEYPLDINFGGIYSPGVTFFRKNAKENYGYLECPFSCGVVSVASIANREKNEFVDEDARYVDENGQLNAEGVKIQANKIATIFRIALTNGHDSIVLGAFGCGAYRLDPEQIASLFEAVLNQEEFKGQFKKVVFAILERPNPKVPQGRLGKFGPFYRLFGIDPYI